MPTNHASKAGTPPGEPSWVPNKGESALVFRMVLHSRRVSPLTSGTASTAH